MTDLSPDDAAIRWARLWQRSHAGGPPWSEAELDAVWRHQLAAPVEGWSAGSPPHAVTCGELLHGPGLEAEGLGMLKDFAKLNRDHPGSDLPPDLATVLYLAAIAAAFVRLDRRLSSLSDEALKLGWQWAADRPWLDEGTRSLLSSAMAKLAAGPSPDA